MGMRESVDMRAGVKTGESLYRMNTYDPDADGRRTGVVSRTVPAFTQSERTALLGWKDAAALTQVLKRSAYGKLPGLFKAGVIEHKTNEAILCPHLHQHLYSILPQNVLISNLPTQQT